MRKETAELVYPILRHGLRLKERLRREEKCNMRNEQAELKRLFHLANGSAGIPAGMTADTFLGIRYPLACWLDEVFVLDADSPWRKEWNEEKIESTLFKTNDRAFRFWEQTRLAEGRSDADALEVFYLCAILGFRGDMRDNVNALLDWRDSVESLIAQGLPVDWPDKPPELPMPETNVPPLRARERLRWMLLSGAAVLGLTILVTACLVVYRWGTL